MEKKKILIFIPYYLPGYKAGGPLRTIENLVFHLGSQYDFFVVTSDRDLGDSSSYLNLSSEKWLPVGQAKVFYIFKSNVKFRLIKKIIDDISPDVIYLNSYFDYHFSIKIILVIKLCGNLKKCKLILAPRGEFSVDALKIKYYKKRIFILLSSLLTLHNGITWHASSSFEVDNIQKIFGKKIGRCIKVAMNLPSSYKIKSFQENVIKNSLFSIDNRFLKVVFISRITKMKNLDYALNVFSEVKCRVAFDIFGPLENKEYWMKCNKLTQGLPENITARYCGVLEHDKIMPVILSYDLLFFPTRGENYGHIISESLLVGTPVLISDKTPWVYLEERKLGWSFSLDDKNKFIEVIESFSKNSIESKMKLRLHIQKEAKKSIPSEKDIEMNRALFDSKIQNFY